MQVTHPQTLSEGDNDVPDAERLGREEHAVAEDGALDVPEAAARTLARQYGLGLSDIRTDTDSETNTESED